MARVWWRRRGARERQGHALGVTPWPALPQLSGPGRAAVEAWVRKTTLCWSVADAWGQVAAVAGGAVGRAGEQRHPGPARWAACVRAGAGWAAKPSGWLGGPLLLFLFFSVFHFFSLV